MGTLVPGAQVKAVSRNRVTSTWLLTSKTRVFTAGQEVNLHPPPLPCSVVEPREKPLPSFTEATCNGRKLKSFCLFAYFSKKKEKLWLKLSWKVPQTDELFVRTLNSVAPERHRFPHGHTATANTLRCHISFPLPGSFRNLWEGKRGGMLNLHGCSFSCFILSCTRLCW